MANYVCTVCGYVYSPETGCDEQGVAAGTEFENVSDDFVCPLCGVGKELFEAE